MRNIVKQIIEVYEFLEDDVSKKVFDAKIQFRFNFSTNQHISLMQDYDPNVYIMRASNILQKQLEANEIIIFYGFTPLAKFNFELIKTKQPNCTFLFCDKRFQELKDDAFLLKNDVKIISPDELIESYKHCKVVVNITSGYRTEVLEFLCNNGVTQVLSGLLFNTTHQYFDKMISLREDEIFVDAGVLDGSTSIQFAQLCNQKYEKIYLFEAERAFEENIRKNISFLPNTELHMKGLWNENNVLSFNSTGNGDGRFASDGMNTMEVVTLDDVLQGKKITFLKMDIEGAELEALEGAKATIQQYKPKLAICIYHKPDDILTIPLYIKKLVPEYKIYMRHYSSINSETVLYAIPN